MITKPRGFRLSVLMAAVAIVGLYLGSLLRSQVIDPRSATRAASYLRTALSYAHQEHTCTEAQQEQFRIAQEWEAQGKVLRSSQRRQYDDVRPVIGHVSPEGSDPAISQLLEADRASQSFVRKIGLQHRALGLRYDEWASYYRRLRWIYEQARAHPEWPLSPLPTPPDSLAPALDKLAASYSEMGDFRAAVRWEREALKHLPQDDARRTTFTARLHAYEFPEAPRR
jgi:hypothetical protein